jgi:hypothetical protein
MWMWQRILIVSAVWLMSQPSARASPPLVLEAMIPLRGVHGRIDHMAIDLPRKRLMVAELGNDSVDIIDLGRGAPVHRISKLRETTRYRLRRTSTILIANGGDGSVGLFNAQDFSLAGRVELGDDADNVRIDPRNGLAAVGYGRGGLALIDPTSRTVIAKISLPAHPEVFRIDPSSGRTCVNIPDAHQVAVVGLDARQVVENWPTHHASANFPMAFDASQSLIASVFR